jgi:hypothetical protein
MFPAPSALINSMQSILGSDVLNSVPGPREILTASWKALAERVSTAEQNYQSIQAERGDPVEGHRDDCIRKIATLRNRVALCTSDPELQQKIWCLLMEQTIGVYEATTKRGLDLVFMGTEQVETALNSHERVLLYRRRVRLFGVIISLLSVAGIAAFLYFAYKAGLNGNLALPILGIPACVLLWSAIGSFAAILYRFTNAGDRELEDPLRWLFSRPLTGIVMGSITFLVIKAGLLTITQTSAGAVTAPAANEAMWLIAFLAGFSDRFADGLLKSLAGRFGADKTQDLVSMQVTTKQASDGILENLSGVLTRKNVEQQMPAASPVSNINQNGGEPTSNKLAESELTVTTVTKQ